MRTDSERVPVGAGDGDVYFDYHDALVQIHMLFESTILTYGFKEYTIENFVDKRYFSGWKGNENCRDTDEMRHGINIDGILGNADPTKNEVLIFLQYTVNIAELFRRRYNEEKAPGFQFNLRTYTLLMSKVRDLLIRLGYELKYIPSKEVLYLIRTDAATDAAIESSEEQVRDMIIEYSSYAVSCDLSRKKIILDSLGKIVEEYDDNQQGDNIELFGSIEFMLRNFSIRRDNTEGANRNDFVAGLTETELLDWYDEIYQLLLLRILKHNNIARMEKIDAVRGLIATQNAAAELLQAEEAAEAAGKKEEPRTAGNGQAESEGENSDSTDPASVPEVEVKTRQPDTFVEMGEINEIRSADPDERDREAVSEERRKLGRRILIGLIIAASLAAAFFGALSGLTDSGSRETDRARTEITSEAETGSDSPEKSSENRSGTAVSAGTRAEGKTKP
ncbi:MAG: hypothetical protein ABS879_05265 [Eubacteriales bacterium]